MQVTLALLAAAVSTLLLAWIGLRDAKRLRVQEGDSASRQPFTSHRRRLLALAAATPGVLLLAGGWWSSTVMWLGGTVTLVWLWVLWIGRARESRAMRRGQRIGASG
ncbi:MAG TPA: hypothetical protein VFX69_16455 [Steroidobacteraceae bacterium]|jgi:hypothetical protein|nr:hypothetical protein [Steroidobacteraceae bacterium]